MSELSVGALSGLAANSYVIDVASGSTLDVTNATGTLPAAQLPAGSILQVVQTVKTDTFSSTSTSYVDITGLSVTITPSSTSNKILILGQLTHATGTLSGASGQYQFAGGNSAAYIGDAGALGQVRGIFGGFSDSDQQANTKSSSGIYLDSPNTTSPVTYKIQARIGNYGTLYVNRSSSDNNVNRVRGASSITVMEVAG